MDGIFGIGFPEMLIIALVLFIVGGPANTTRWARELGRTLRKARDTWQQIIAEIEKDVPGTHEAMNSVIELSQTVRDATLSPQRMINDTLRMTEFSASGGEDPSLSSKTAIRPALPVSQPDASANGKRYTAWLPPEDPPKG